jgi:tetratricopeptide (TPR) repeat protein
VDILSGHLRKVRGYLNLGKPRRALFILEEIPTHHRTDDRYERMEFEVYMAMERWDKALEVANELVMEFREDAEAKIFRSWSLLELGMIESALDTLDQIPTDGLDDARYHYVLARLMMRFGHDQLARESLDRAIDLDPDMAKIAASLPGTARLMGMR